MKTIALRQSSFWPRVLAGVTVATTATGVVFFSRSWFFWLVAGAGVLFTYTVVQSTAPASKETVVLSLVVVLVTVLAASVHVVRDGEISDEAWETVPAVLRADFMTLEGLRSMLSFLLTRALVLAAALALLAVVGGQPLGKLPRLGGAAMVLAAAHVPADFAWRAPLVSIGVHEASRPGANRVLTILSLGEPVVLFILVGALVLAASFCQRPAARASPT